MKNRYRRRSQIKQQTDDWGYLLALPILSAAWVVKWGWRKVRSIVRR